MYVEGLLVVHGNTHLLRLLYINFRPTFAASFSNLSSIV
jgi:hypothetical protein